MNSSGKLLLKGSLSRSLLLASNILIGFFMMPFLIHTLGDTHYGMWILATTITSLYNAIDLGMSNAMQRFIVRSLHDQDKNSTKTAIATSFVFYLTFSIAVLIITTAVFLISPMFTDSANTHELQICIAILGLKVAVQLPLFTYYAVLISHSRFDIISHIQLIALALRTILILAFLNTSEGLIILASIVFLIDIFTSIAIFLIARSIEPKSRTISLSFFNISSLKEYFHFGKYVYLIQLSNRIRFSIDNFVIARMIGISALAPYSIASTLTTYFNSFMDSSFSVVNPTFQKHHKLNNWERLRSTFIITTELSTYTASFIAGQLAVLGSSFINLWIGKEYLDAVLPLIFLAIASFAIKSQLANQGILLAIAQHRYYAALLSIESLFNLTFSIILGHYLGLSGVALGTMLPALVNSFIFLPRYVCAQLHISRSNIYSPLAKAVLVTTIAFLPEYLITSRFTIDSYLNLFFVALAGCMLYLLLCIRYALSQETLSTILQNIPAPISSLIRPICRT